MTSQEVRDMDDAVAVEARGVGAKAEEASAFLDYFSEETARAEAAAAEAEARAEAAERQAAEAKARAEAAEWKAAAHAARAADLQRCMDAATGPGAVKTITEAARTALQAVEDGAPSVHQSLLAVQTIWPKRVEILPSAWRSAAEASSFKHGRRVFDLLSLLVRPYAEALGTGGGDAEARRILGAAYAANESETVQGNRRAMGLRTFTYGGRSVAFLQHLRIGNKESVAETWRCHFLWDAERKVVVIGHCGKHLDAR